MRKTKPATKPRAPAAEARFRLRAGVAHREIEGQLLLLTPSGAEIYCLNESGKLVWEGLLRGRSVSTMARLLAEEYGLPQERAREDVLSLLAELQRKRVILRA